MADTLALFPDLAAAAPVAGLRYEEDVLSPEVQAGFLDWVPSVALAPFDFRGFKGARRIASFGSRYDFFQNRVRPAEPMPQALVPLRAAAAAFADLPETALAQALVTEYVPGAGIGWHRDRPEYGQVIGLSFVSECVLRFRRPEDGGWRRAAQILRPGSAYLLDGPARDAWQHSIVPGETLRYSVTFRTLRTTPTHDGGGSSRPWIDKAKPGGAP